MRADVNELIDGFIGRGECEFITELGALLPGWAFFKNVMGVPLSDLQMLLGLIASNGAPSRRLPRKKENTLKSSSVT